MKWSDLRYNNFYIPYDENRKTICGFLLTTLGIDLENLPNNFFEPFSFFERHRNADNTYEHRKVFLHDVVGTSYSDYSTDNKLIYSYIKLKRVCKYIMDNRISSGKYFKMLKNPIQENPIILTMLSNGKFFVDGNGNHRIILYKILMLSEIAMKYPYVFDDDYDLNFSGFEDVKKKYWLYAKVKCNDNNSLKVRERTTIYGKILL